MRPCRVTSRGWHTRKTLTRIRAVDYDLRGFYIPHRDRAWAIARLSRRQWCARGNIRSLLRRLQAQASAASDRTQWYFRYCPGTGQRPTLRHIRNATASRDEQTFGIRHFVPEAAIASFVSCADMKPNRIPPHFSGSTGAIGRRAFQTPTLNLVRGGRGQPLPIVIHGRQRRSGKVRSEG